MESQLEREILSARKEKLFEDLVMSKKQGDLGEYLGLWFNSVFDSVILSRLEFGKIFTIIVSKHEVDGCNSRKTLHAGCAHDAKLLPCNIPTTLIVEMAMQAIVRNIASSWKCLRGSDLCSMHPCELNTIKSDTGEDHSTPSTSWLTLAIPKPPGS